MEKKVKQKIKTDKKKQKIIVIVSLFIIIIFLCIYLYANLIDMFSLFERKEIYSEVEVSNILGFEINDSALVFGTVYPGGSSKKTVDLKNEHDGIARVKIFAKGDINDFLIVSDNNFILYPNETKTIEFKIKIPENTAFGNYTGKVIFEIRNAIVK